MTEATTGGQVTAGSTKGTVGISALTCHTGVDYNSRGRTAPCPGSGCKVKRAKITTVMPWENDLRVRYHACAKCGQKFKSIETREPVLKVNVPPAAAPGFRSDSRHPLRRG